MIKMYERSFSKTCVPFHLPQPHSRALHELKRLLAVGECRGMGETSKTSNQ